MAIKIKQMFGYQISYDVRRRQFIVEDTDGTELAYAQTQDEIEVKAKALSKQEFKRISIVKVNQEGIITSGELTSLDRADKSAWVSMEKSKYSWGSGRQKISLNSDRGYYESTDKNLIISENIKAKAEDLNRIRVEINALEATLEKPINRAYFGIEG